MYKPITVFLKGVTLSFPEIFVLRATLQLKMHLYIYKYILVHTYF